MNKKELYTNYLSKLEESVENNNFDNIDYILEYIYSSGMDEQMLDSIDELLQEATLYSEFKEEEYKTKFLELINQYK